MELVHNVKVTLDFVGFFKKIIIINIIIEQFKLNRMERVELRSVGGIVKVLGIALCMGGVATIAFYRGPTLKLLMHHHLIDHHDQHLQVNPSSGKAWVKGVFLMLLANTCWSLWLVVQVHILLIDISN